MERWKERESETKKKREVGGVREGERGGGREMSIKTDIAHFEYSKFHLPQMSNYSGMRLRIIV